MSVYGFNETDVGRIRRLLAAFEQGRIRLDAPRHFIDLHQCDSQLGTTGSTVGAGTTGTATLVNLDTSSPPVGTVETALTTIPVYNPGTGISLYAREPSQGYYVRVGGLTQLNAAISSGSLTTSWANITGLSLALPANSTWIVLAQINAEITSSSTGAADSISFRYYDGSTQYGETLEICSAVCDSITFPDAGPLNAVVTVGVSTVTLSVQGIVNTTTGSTGAMLGSTLIGIQV